MIVLWIIFEKVIIFPRDYFQKNLQSNLSQTMQIVMDFGRNWQKMNRFIGMEYHFGFIDVAYIQCLLLLTKSRMLTKWFYLKIKKKNMVRQFGITFLAKLLLNNMYRTT